MKKKVFVKRIVVVLFFLIICTVGFVVWASFYYKADTIAISTFETLESSGKAEKVDNMILMHPSSSNGTGIIFYPGAKVETIAYIPLFEELRQHGFTCVLIEMPLHLSFFNSNAADDVYELVPSINNWYIAGHSLGGAMASDYASKNPEKVEGLIVMGAYVYGNYPPTRALTVYGTFNADLEKNIDYSDNIVIIDGGNHAQFGNYGKQKGDPDSTISSKDQQVQTVNAIVQFIGNH